MNTSKELLTTSLEHAVLDYEEFGVCLVEYAASLELMDEWARILEYHCDEFICNDSIGSMGERGNYLVLDGPRTRKWLPEVEILYDKFKDWGSYIVGKQAVFSPYELSAINAKVYPPEWGCQGLHYDTQPFTCLLYVTGGAPTQIQLLNGEWMDIEPIAGTVAFFQGREMQHRVPSGPEFRATVPFNFYFEDDMERPEWIDAAVYENKDFRSA